MVKKKTRKQFKSKNKKRKTQKNMWKNGEIRGFIASKKKAKNVLKKISTLDEYDIKKNLNLYVPPSNQRNSGRCWMFSFLNALRLSLISTYKLPPTFSLSTSYMTFWDKYEKCNYFLHQVSKYSNLSLDDINNHLLFSSMISDGGTWNMIQNIIGKYGIVPYDDMKESFHTIKTNQMNEVLFRVLQKNAKEIRSCSKEKHPVIMKRQMKQIHRFLCKCIGTPPKKVISLKQYKKEYTPQELYLNEIKPISGNDVHRKVVLINVPHLQENQYYTVKEMNNMEGGIMIYYFNVNAKTMKHYVIQQLFDNKCVWFGCDYDKFNYKEESLLNNTLFSYDKFLLKKKDLILSKSNALPFYQTSVNHAMSFTGFYHRPTARKTPLYWNVENSHSTKMNEISFQDSHGHLIMSDSWFDSFVVISVVDEMYFKNDTLASKIRDKDNVIELPKWSYLGELLLH